MLEATASKPYNRFIVVELDTRQQDSDPDDNHVGLDMNGVQSQVYKSLLPHGIELVPINRSDIQFYNVWVQYDGDKKAKEVYIAKQLWFTNPTPSMPRAPLLRSELDLREWLDQHSYFGFSASNGDGAQLTIVLRWNLTVKYFPEKKGSPLKIELGAGIPAVVLLVMFAAAMGYYLLKNMRGMNQYGSKLVEALRNLPGMVREFQYGDLQKATDNFDDKWKLGHGGFGLVYRGILASENLEVAVKWFSRESIKGEDDFLAELTIINRLRHKHLVRLLGWCHNNGKLLLLYKYMPNGSLDKNFDNEERKYFHCYEPGHYKSNCPVRRNEKREKKKKLYNRLKHALKGPLGESEESKSEEDESDTDSSVEEKANLCLMAKDGKAYKSLPYG